MSTEAPWWDGNSQDDKPVRRHAPDNYNYHMPDDRQMEKISGSRVGRFAIIPEARSNGVSRGFDPTVAGPVHVDPDAPDGGVVFDPRGVREQDLAAAVASSIYPHQTFYQLGVAAKNRGYTEMAPSIAVDRRPNPLLPNTYIAPHSQPGQEGLNVSNLPTLPPAPQLQPLVANQYPQAYPPNGGMPQPQQMAQPQPQPQQQPQTQQYAPQYYMPQPAYAPPDPSLMAVIAQLQQQVTNLASRPTFPQTTGPSQNPLPIARPAVATTPVEQQHGSRGYSPAHSDFDESARPIRAKRQQPEQQRERDDEAQEAGQRQTVSAFTESQREPEYVITGFETLKMAYVTGPFGLKAKRQVIFEIPGAGKHTARYHDVIVSPTCVTLVYDTRYEDGQQYIPPELDDKKIILHIPAMKKSFVVSSLGLNYPCGVFDHTVLVLHPDAQPNEEEE